LVARKPPVVKLTSDCRFLWISKSESQETGVSGESEQNYILRLIKRGEGV